MDGSPSANSAEERTQPVVTELHLIQVSLAGISRQRRRTHAPPIHCHGLRARSRPGICAGNFHENETEHFSLIGKSQLRGIRAPEDQTRRLVWEPTSEPHNIAER